MLALGNVIKEAVENHHMITGELSLNDNVVNNVGGYSAQQALAVYRPHTVAALSAFVKLISSLPHTIKLATYSSGYNWGLSSRSICEHNTVLVDMQHLNQILDISSGTALIQPGVTQQQLSLALKDSNYTVNLTASAPQTSIIGNTLERGVGLRGQRTDDLIGVEVILPTGEILGAGGWMGFEKMPATLDYPHGLGPNLLGLFSQSNFALVVAARIRLKRRRQHKIVRACFSHSHYVPAMTLIQHLLQEELIKPVAKIYNPLSANAQAGLADNLYSGYFIVEAHQRVLSTQCQVTIDCICKSGFFTSANILHNKDQHSILEQMLIDGVRGEPEHSASMMQHIFTVSPHNIDQQTQQGWRFLLPMIPYQADSLYEAEQLLVAVGKKYKITIGATINALSDTLVDYVVVFQFALNHLSIKNAQCAQDKLLHEFDCRGWAPYRLDISHRQWMHNKISPPYHDLLEKIKAAIDPKNIMAQGRY